MDIPLKVEDRGLFCKTGNFFIDAWKPTPICVITHAHGDHAYFGHELYIASPETIKIIQHRLGKDIPCKILEYGEKIRLGNCHVSLHPAGHILGSSQVRIEDDIFVTESTFALPIYHWPKNEILENQIYEWWQENAYHHHPSLLFCYALGKAQRVMHMLKNKTEKCVYVHDAVLTMCKLYQEMGVEMCDFRPISEKDKGASFSQELIIAPPSAMGTPWMRRFPLCKTAFTSGWMEVRGTRRRKALDRGFILSDHADWRGLIKTIKETKAKIWKS